MYGSHRSYAQRIGGLPAPLPDGMDVTRVTPWYHRSYVQPTAGLGLPHGVSVTAVMLSVLAGCLQLYPCYDCHRSYAQRTGGLLPPFRMTRFGSFVVVVVLRPSNS